MRVIKTRFKGLFIIKQKSNRDSRGSLRETHNQKIINFNKFIFEYCTSSKKNVFGAFTYKQNFLKLSL